MAIDVEIPRAAASRGRRRRRSALARCRRPDAAPCANAISGAAPGAVYLMRPDQHVAARWTAFDETSSCAALRQGDRKGVIDMAALVTKPNIEAAGRFLRRVDRAARRHAVRRRARRSTRGSSCCCAITSATARRFAKPLRPPSRSQRRMPRSSGAVSGDRRPEVRRRGGQANVLSNGRLLVEARRLPSSCPDLFRASTPSCNPS